MMITRLPIAFVLAGLIGAAGVVAAINAKAQQSPQQQSPQNESSWSAKTGRGYGEKFSPADKAAFFDARLAGLHAGLTLTPDQDKLWPPVETALRDTAKTMAERRRIWKDEPRPADPVQLLQRISAGALARGESLKKLADAVAPLYALLNDEQKHRLPILMAHLRPHGMRFAMAGEHRFDQDEEMHGGWSHDHHGHDGENGHDGEDGQGPDHSDH